MKRFIDIVIHIKYYNAMKTFHFFSMEKQNLPDPLYPTINVQAFNSSNYP